MARGQAEAAGAQLARTNAIGDIYNTEAQGIQRGLIPTYQNLMETGYTSPEAGASATATEMGAATAPFEAAGFEASNRAARTRNAADLTAQQDQLALEKGRTAAGAAANLQEEKMRNQLAGAYGLGQIGSEDLRAMEAMYGLGPGTLEARAAGTGHWGVTGPFGIGIKSG